MDDTVKKGGSSDDPVGWNAAAGGCDNSARANHGDGGKSDSEDDACMMDELANVEIPLHLEPAATNTQSTSPDDSAIIRADAGAPSLVNGWDDNAAISCFELAVKSHSMTHDEFVGEGEGEGRASWEPGPNVLPKISPLDHNAGSKSNGTTGKDKESTSEKAQGLLDEATRDGHTDAVDKKNERWRPRPVPLPNWAVDPAYAAAHLDSK
mmetsp:Transcript_7410/g.14769  ORF Transcript_7410/g.14769 Transcript_7410/m.14769 type:complete len:209 (+) Transcript_7410:781-1407(+)